MIRRTACLASGLLLLLAACGGPERVERGTGNAAWVGRETALDGEMVEALRRAGVRELVVEAGEVVWEEAGPRVVGRVAAGGVRMPAVLAVRGRWEGGDDGRAAGEALAAELRRVGFAAAGAAWTPAGILLDLEPPRDEDGLAAYGEALERLREGRGGEGFLAVSLDRAALHGPVEDLAAAADLVVAFLYGPRAGGGPGPEGAAPWDLAGLEADLARLEELGTPYLLGVGTLGRLTRAGAGGGEVLHTARLSRLLATPGLRYVPPSVLESRDAQLYAFRAERSLLLDGWQVAAGETLEVHRLAPHHLGALAARVAKARPALHRGMLFDRLAAAGEGLALGVDELAAATDPAAGGPRLELVVGASRGRRGALVVTVAHRGGGATELARLDHNYVEIRLDGGVVGRVDPGGFGRHELRRGGRRTATMRDARRADAVRLHVPILEAGDEVTSGPIEVSGRARVGGEFLVPGGGVVSLPEQEWPPPGPG